MNLFEVELTKLIDSAVKSSVDISSYSSLQELYDAKKKSLGLSDRQIQEILGIQRNSLNPILNGEGKQINLISVIKLAHFLGLSVNDLIKVYVPKLPSVHIGEIQRAREAGYIAANFDIAALSRARFFGSGISAQEMSARIKQFFSLESIYDYGEGTIAPAFSRTRRNSNDLMRNFWVMSAYAQFKEIGNPNPYDRAALLSLVPKIKPYTRDVKTGLLKVLKALYSVGVTVIFQPSIEKVQVRGATMVVDGKPCIVLSDLKKIYPTLWFTLLHELHHVLFDLDDIRTQSYHISDEAGYDLFLMNEARADDFAREYLLSDSRMKFAKRYIRSDFHIEKLAKEWGIHKSIIYAFHCYDTNEWAFYGKFIPKMEESLELLNTHPFEKDSLIESAQQVKQMIFNQSPT